MTPFNGLYLLLFIYFSTFVDWSAESSNTGSRARTLYEAIKSYVERLDTKEIRTGDYSFLSVDEKYNHLLAGAKDNAFIVDLDNIKDYKSWNLTYPGFKRDCDGIQDCHDFVRTMLPFNERILVCWTGNSGCAWKNGSGRCTAAQLLILIQNLTHLTQKYLAEQGRLFIGTIHSYNTKAMIYSKSFKDPKLKVKAVYTAFGDNDDLYQDVHFVKSFSIGYYAYFFFREWTLECKDCCGKQQVSRVARICKGDYGDEYNNNFVTFQKAKLTCPDGGKYPVYFNEIQDVWWDNQTKQFYAAFNTHPNGPPMSAICVYSLSDIDDVFDTSPFKTFDSDIDQWVPRANNHLDYFNKNCKVNKTYLNPSNNKPVPTGMMATRKLKFLALRELIHDPLMEDVVQPISFDSRARRVPIAWFIKDGIRITAIALDKVGAHTVVYTSTDRGSVLKISKPDGVHQPCLLTEMDLFPSYKKEVIRKMAIDRTRHVLYFGSDTVTKLSLQQCSSHEHQSSCLSAADPYCAWDNETRRCVSVLSHGDPRKLKQDLTTCPKVTEGEVEWSPWKTCVQSDGNLCRCQARPCQNSSCGGVYEFRLQNCTVDVSVGWEGKEAWETYGVQHGNWSTWGNWSECNAEAWAGVRHRTRTCTDPVPRRGGRPCVGESVQYEPCGLGLEDRTKHVSTNPTRPLNSTGSMAVQFNVLCVATGHKITGITMKMSNRTLDCGKQPELCGAGEWDKWSDWSQCSEEGLQFRRRQCKAEPCVGERLEERKCDPSNKCKDIDINSWDEWSVCQCDHELNLEEGSGVGVKYRILKCRRECPTVTGCLDTVQYETCSCRSTGVSGRRAAPGPSEGSNLEIGHVIAAAVAGCVFTIILCCAALYYVKRRKKRFNVSKAEESNLHNTSSDSRYTSIPRGGSTSTRGPPSTSSSQSTASKDSINTRKNKSSALKMIRLFRKPENTAANV